MENSGSREGSSYGGGWKYPTSPVQSLDKKGHGSSLALAALAEANASMASSEGLHIGMMSSPDYSRNQVFGFGRHDGGGPFASAFHNEEDEQCDTISDKVTVHKVDVAVRMGYSCRKGEKGVEVEVGACESEVVSVMGFAGNPSITFVGVFEGHGEYGRHVALLVASFVTKYLEKSLKQMGLLSDEGVKEALHDVSSAANKHLISSGIDVSASGSTACFGLLLSDKAFVASIGNARCLVVSDDALGRSLVVEKISCDANPSSPVELERIQNAGGIVGRFENEDGIPYGSLRIFKDGSKVVPGVTSSRILGHESAHSCGAVAEPLVCEYTLNDRNKVVIFATEGTWNAIQDEDAARVVAQFGKYPVDGLTAADLLSHFAQSASEQKNTDEEISDVALAVIYMGTSFATAKPSKDLHEMDLAVFAAATCNEDACMSSRELQYAGCMGEQKSAADRTFVLLETLCHLNEKEMFEISERTSSLTLAMRRESEDLPNARQPGSTSEGTRQPSFARGSQDDTFIPSQAIGVPISKVRINSQKAHQSAPMSRLLSGEEDLPPIRKAHLSYMNLNGSLEGNNLYSQKSQPEAWMLDGVETPRSSDSCGSGLKDEKPHRGELRHEGKVHRGIPCSISSVGLRLSSDSDGSINRLGSLDESLSLGLRSLDISSPIKARTGSGSIHKGEVSPLRHSSLSVPKTSKALEGTSNNQGYPISRSFSNVVVLKDLQ
ncbi:Putative protein phosphatase 2C 64 [Picochlorum sp. SENEW3]|nr:Putative protein phosphatase 2C 64 [Picochlorum sp. SENEW3]